MEISKFKTTIDPFYKVTPQLIQTISAPITNFSSEWGYGFCLENKALFNNVFSWCIKNNVRFNLSSAQNASFLIFTFEKVWQASDFSTIVYGIQNKILSCDSGDRFNSAYWLNFYSQEKKKTNTFKTNIPMYSTKYITSEVVSLFKFLSDNFPDGSWCLNYKKINDEMHIVVDFINKNDCFACKLLYDK